MTDIDNMKEERQDVDQKLRRTDAAIMEANKMLMEEKGAHLKQSLLGDNVQEVDRDDIDRHDWRP